MIGGTTLAICSVMLGCGCNVIFLEYLIGASTSSGNMIVFFQFLFIATEGFLNHYKFGRTRRVIPLKNYMVMVVLYFTINVTNIMAFNCNIPMPLHMIFKSGSLVANLVIGSILLKRQYPLSKYCAVLFVSLGILTCTAATGMTKVAATSTSDEDNKSLLIMLVGVALLTFALVLSARLGVYQEVLYTKYGQHSREALFYNHVIPLPFFALLAPSIISNIKVLNESEPRPVPLISNLVTMATGDGSFYSDLTSVPILWLYLLANLVTQYVCIRSIFYLTTVCTSLTVTLIITLRKFISLIISVWYFQNEFTRLHYLGTSFVFLGTLLYTGIFLRIFQEKEKLTDSVDKLQQKANGFINSARSDKAKVA